MLYTILAEITVPGTEFVTTAIQKTTTEVGLLAVYVLGALFLMGMFFGGLHYKYVVIPRNNADLKKFDAEIENGKKLTETMDSLAKVSSDMYTKTKVISDTVFNIKVKLAALIAVKQHELDAISVVATKTGVDLSKQIDMASGALSLLENFEHNEKS